MEANITIKQKKLSIPKQEISILLHSLNEIITEYKLYQRISTEAKIYQISSEQSDVKSQTFFLYKKAILKNSNDTIKFQIYGKKLFSLLEEKNCYKFEDLLPDENSI